MEKELVATDMLKQVDELHSLIISREWRQFSRQDFIEVLEKSIAMLTELKHSLERAQKLIGLETAGEKPEIWGLLEEAEKLAALLEKNKRFELHKASRAREINLLEKEESPGVYNAIEQKMLAFLLKARYAVERVNIFFRKQAGSPFQIEKGTTKNLLSLLEKKETEIEELKGKYADIRKKSYLGYVEEQSVADMEMEINETARTMAGEMEKLNHNISSHGKQLDYIQANYAELKEKLAAIEEKFSSFMQKSIELSGMLKKERDYAKRIVLEIEHETLQLRNTYTRELLSLQEEKAKAKKEAEKMFHEKMGKLEMGLEKSEKDAEHFRETAAERMQRIKELEQRIYSMKNRKEKRSKKK